MELSEMECINLRDDVIKVFGIYFSGNKKLFFSVKVFFTDTDDSQDNFACDMTITYF